MTKPHQCSRRAGSRLNCALLTFWDQHVEEGTLQVSFKPHGVGDGRGGQLRAQKLPGDAGKPALRDVVRNYRFFGWPDVQASQ